MRDEMRERLQLVGAVGAWWSVGIATDIFIDRMGWVHQSSAVAYWIGALLRSWFWPYFWVMKLREYLIGF